MYLSGMLCSHLMCFRPAGPRTDRHRLLSDPHPCPSREEGLISDELCSCSALTGSTGILPVSHSGRSAAIRAPIAILVSKLQA